MTRREESIYDFPGICSLSTPATHAFTEQSPHSTDDAAHCPCTSKRSIDHLDFTCVDRSIHHAFVLFYLAALYSDDLEAGLHGPPRVLHSPQVPGFQPSHLDAPSCRSCLHSLGALVGMAVHSGKVLWGFTVAPSSHINDVANFNVRYFFLLAFLLIHC